MDHNRDFFTVIIRYEWWQLGGLPITMACLLAR